MIKISVEKQMSWNEPEDDAKKNDPWSGKGRKGKGRRGAGHKAIMIGKASVSSARLPRKDDRVQAR